MIFLISWINPFSNKIKMKTFKLLMNKKIQKYFLRKLIINRIIFYLRKKTKRIMISKNNLVKNNLNK